MWSGAFVATIPPPICRECRGFGSLWDVADWLVQWFKPAHQVEVIEIDSGGVLRKGKPGRTLIGDVPMTAAERQRRRRALVLAAIADAIPDP